MDGKVNRVVVVGGGTAGWITASLLAARRRVDAPDALQITLVESPDVPTIGVGEGTWPTIRRTLKKIGVAEADFVLACDASFKQGSRFDGWVNGETGDRYLHPFALPASGDGDALIAAWRAFAPDKPFADVVCAQADACRQGLAPKQEGAPDYEGALNYAYHLDASKLAVLLRDHAVTKLGVRHIRDHVAGVRAALNGDIAAVLTAAHGAVEGDLFVDCTGFGALLLGRHYGVGFTPQGHVLLNDRALAVQAPYATENAPIASQTIATAHEAGWIWDIGLPTRRGVGCVYASQFMSDEAAADQLRTYLRRTDAGAPLDKLNVRRLAFEIGYRKDFWRRNCLAIGLSAGFIEPLEASAIVMIELSASFLADNFPVDRTAMAVSEKRFNELFTYRWGRIVDFLKLHYVLSQRPGPYWRAQRAPQTIPDRLADSLELWKHQAPSIADLPHAEEIFPPASYQYILYGMGFGMRRKPAFVPHEARASLRELRQIGERKSRLAASLPANRTLLASLKNRLSPSGAGSAQGNG